MSLFGNKPPKPPPEPLIYTIFPAVGPPLCISSTIDLVWAWRLALENRSKYKDWWRPIDFADEDGKIIASFATNGIIGIVQGAVANPLMRKEA